MGGRKVVVLGGGIGGLSAAHELSERGFSVEIFDLRNIPGGKSRTLPASGTHPPLPGEHGFRFFPAFYQHLPDTMKRIPVDGNRTCFDNLVSANRLELALYEAPGLRLPTRFPRSAHDIELLIGAWQNRASNFAPGELPFYADRLWQVMTSCDERRKAELETQSWWDYTGADSRSANYRRVLANGLSRSLVAAQPKIASARTIGQVQVHLLAGAFMPSFATDRVLSGPTSDVFLNPWIDYLKQRGVAYHTNSRVTKLNFAQKRLVGVTVNDACEPKEKGRNIAADWIIAAVPVEAMLALLDEDVLDQAPELAVIRAIAPNVRWMNGIQFFLKEEVPVVRGHVLHLDSPWAITSISEVQFWKHPFRSFGEEVVKEVLSVDISDWEAPGRFVRKKAMRLGAAEIAREVWEELKTNLNVGGRTLLRDEMLHSFFLDTDIVLPNPHRSINLEPLFINTPGSWPLRPHATTSIPNLFLASDYVQTNTDLACMEAANEAARHAVNGLLDQADSAAPRCRIWSMEMPAPLAPLRWRDRARFDRGEPWNGSLLPFGERGALLPTIATHEQKLAAPLAKASDPRALRSPLPPSAPATALRPADDAFHYRDYAGRAKSFGFIEWWYFNFVDAASGYSGMLTFAIFNPGNAAGLSTASFNAVAFGPSGRVVTVMDYYRGEQFAASYDKADVTLAGNRLTAIDATTSSIGAVSKDRRLGFDLTFKAADKPQLLEDSVRGYEKWEVSSWLAYMPAATVSGSFVVDGVQHNLNAAAGYHDHDWGIWALPFRTWSWGAFAAPDKDMALDIGFHAAFQHSVAYFRLGNERISFTKFKISQSRWHHWRAFWKYPMRTIFTATDHAETRKLEVTWDVLETAPLWKYPLLVFEQTAHFTGAYYTRRGKGWQKIASIDENGFCEDTGTWTDPLSFAARQY